jgi:predicted amidohydrolase YtcJ
LNNKKISNVGSKIQVLAVSGVHVTDIDLAGKTLVPSFRDGRAYFSNFASQVIGTQLLLPPNASAKYIAKTIEMVKQWNTAENRALTGWILGNGFDDSVITENAS